MHWNLLLPTIFSLLISCPVYATTSGYEKPNVQATVAGNSAFALSLYRELKDRPGNITTSPYSISSVLAMAYAGAGTITADEMAKALHFSPDQGRLHQDLAHITTRLQTAGQRDKISLHIANSIWPQSGYPFLGDYLDLLNTYYHSTVTPLDYRTNPERARSKINQWVTNKTGEKITDLIQPNSLDPLTRMVLVNAITFKGEWQSRFNRKETRPGPFHLNKDKVAQAQMMRQTGTFAYGRFDDLQVLELPYGAGEISLLLLLPSQNNGLADLEQILSLDTISQWTTSLSRKKVEVILPRFKTSSQFSLAGPLTALGMETAFDRQRADFSGMDGKSHWLYISAVIHKALIEVNEEGAEATGASAVVIKSYGAPAPPATFHADHPFLFFIRDNDTGTILFLGRVVDPT